jgi:hypothetical protein
MSEQAKNLMVIVFRKSTGCRQYAFQNLTELEAFTGRHPYKNETLRVMTIKDRKIIDDKAVIASIAVDFVKTSLSIGF